MSTPTTLGAADAPLHFAAEVRGASIEHHVIVVYANSRTEARRLCAEAGLIVYRLVSAWRAQEATA